MEYMIPKDVKISTELEEHELENYMTLYVDGSSNPNRRGAKLILTSLGGVVVEYAQPF